MNTSYNAFEHLWRTCFLASEQPENRLMAMFTFYGDESYGNANAYSVGGYIAKVEQWTELARELRELGAAEGFTVLHKRKLEYFKGDFNWPDLTDEERKAKRDRINKRTCEIILRRVSAGFSAAVAKTEWQEVAAQSRWAGALGKSFYAAGVFVCLNLVTSWTKKFPRREPIDGIRYIFEEGAEGRHEAEGMLRLFKKTPSERERFMIHGYSFEDKKDPDFSPLQAADFLAYEGYRQLDNQIVEGVKLDKDGNPRPVRGALRCLLRRDDPQYARIDPDKLPVPHYGLYLDRWKIEDLISKLDERFPPEDESTDYYP